MKAFFFRLSHFLLAVLGSVAFAQETLPLRHALFSGSALFRTAGKQGAAVATDGDYLVLGEAGVVKVYSANNADLLFRLNNPGNSSNGFGKSVAIHGTIVAVGAPTDYSINESGFVYLYDLAGPQPTVPIMTFTRGSISSAGEFGSAVAIFENHLVIGAPKGEVDLLNPMIGVVRIFDLSSPTPTTPVVTIPNPTPAAGDLFGAAVAVSGNNVVVGAPQDDATATDTGIAYLFDLSAVSTTTPLVTFTAEDATAGDLYGFAVAVSNAKVVIGSPSNDTGALHTGRAFVYDLADGTPATSTFTLPNPGAQVDDAFGSSVAINVDRVVVGAPKSDSTGNDSGKAYSYDLASGTPATADLVFENPTPSINDQFGSAVAVSSTFILVGAPNDDEAATDGGAGYYYNPNGATPETSIATLKETTPIFGDAFGTVVAADGPLLAVSAPFDDTGVTNAGRVFVFDLASGSPTVPFVTLANPDAATSAASFGTRLAVSGSLVVVGVPNDSTNATNSGRVYVFDVSSGTPTVPIATLVNPTPATDDFFGGSVSISGTFVAVGAPGDDGAGSGTGIAYVYDVVIPASPILVFTFNNPDPTPLDTFGDGIGISASGTRLVVGASGDRVGSQRIGAAYVYDLTIATPTTPLRKLPNPVPTSDSLFGSVVAISGDRLVLGAPPFLPSSPPGRLYIYNLASKSTKPTVTIKAPSQDGLPIFSGSVAISDSILLVGSRARTTGFGGRAYLYDLSGSTANPIFTQQHPRGALDVIFGSSVVIAGGTAVVGDSQDDFRAPDQGAAFVFDIVVPNSTVNVATQMTAIDPTLPGALFDSFTVPDAEVFGGKLRTTDGKKLDAVFDDTGTVLLRGGKMEAVEEGGPMAMVMKLMPPTGDAVLATFQRGTNVASDSDQTLFTGLMDGTPQPAVRRGQDLGGGVKLKSFLTLDGNGTTTFFSGTLKGDGVNSGNGQALFAVLPPGGIPSLPESGPPATGLRMLVRKGQPVTTPRGAKTVRTIATLVGQAGSLAEGRWRSGPNSIGVRLTFTDKTQALYIMPAGATSSDDWLLLGQTDDDGGPDLDPATQLLGFNLPAYAPQATIFESLLRIGPGGVTKRDNGVVFDAVGVEMGGPITRRTLARRARPAPSLPTSNLSRFRATLAGIARGSTFVAQTTVNARSADSVFDARGDGVFRQVARIGDPAPGGGRFTRFTSIARPDTNGYGAFVSALLGGVSPKNRNVLFAMDSGGELRRMIRTGDRLESAGPGSPLKAIKSFVALSAAPGSIGAARGYGEDGRITVLVTFTDRSQAVVTLQVP